MDHISGSLGLLKNQIVIIAFAVFATAQGFVESLSGWVSLVAGILGIILIAINIYIKFMEARKAKREDAEAVLKAAASGENKAPQKKRPKNMKTRRLRKRREGPDPVQGHE